MEFKYGVRPKVGSRDSVKMKEIFIEKNLEA